MNSVQPSFRLIYGLENTDTLLYFSASKGLNQAHSKDS